jgi:hypothetical protein
MDEDLFPLLPLPSLKAELLSVYKEPQPETMLCVEVIVEC